MFLLRIDCVLVVLLLNGALSIGCGPSFSGKCICGIQQYDYHEKYVVNCTNLGFNNTDILEFLPKETQVLIFTGNRIPEMPWNVFGTLNILENLKIVDMSNNGIREIKGKSYHHVQNVERLILNHNELVISSDDNPDVNHHHPRVLSNFVNLLELHLTNAFADNTDAALANDLHDIFVNSNLTRLQKLHLEQNEIVTFRDRRVFCDLPQLRDLHLGDNQLTGLNFNISCLLHLRFLDLEDNQIETLTKYELNTMDKISSRKGRDDALILDIRGNPFLCDCSISDFHSWVKSTNVTVRQKESIKCAKPKSFSGSSLVKLKVTPCKRAIILSAPTKGQKATMGLLIFVTLTMFLLFAILLYSSRYQLRSKLSPLIEAISKKVQYTTIKNRDNIDDI